MTNLPVDDSAHGASSCKCSDTKRKPSCLEEVLLDYETLIASRSTSVSSTEVCPVSGFLFHPALPFFFSETPSIAILNPSQYLLAASFEPRGRRPALLYDFWQACVRTVHPQSQRSIFLLPPFFLFLCSWLHGCKPEPLLFLRFSIAVSVTWVAIGDEECGNVGCADLLDLSRGDAR